MIRREDVTDREYVLSMVYVLELVNESLHEPPSLVNVPDDDAVFSFV